MKETLFNVWTGTVDQLDPLISRIVDKLGMVSIGGGFGISFGLFDSTAVEVSSWGIAQWSFVMSSIGVTSFVIKNLAEVYFAHRRHKRETAQFERDLVQNGGEKE